MAAKLGRTEVLALLSLSCACVGVLANTFQGDGEPLIASLAFSGLAFAFTYALIRWLGNAFMRAGFKGRDLSKLRQAEMCVLPTNAPITLHCPPMLSRCQPRDHGRRLRRCVSTHYHRLHPVALLQGHRGRHVGWW
jgi:hypothetical protein